MKEAFDLIRKRIEEVRTIEQFNRGKMLKENDYTGANIAHRGIVMLNDALRIVSEVAAEYGNGWIPCSERLPENDDDVLVWYRYRTMQGVNIVGSKETHGIGYYNKPTNSWLIYGGFGLYWNAVAWMPLPSPYTPTTD